MGEHKHVTVKFWLRPMLSKLLEKVALSGTVSVAITVSIPFVVPEVVLQWTSTVTSIVIILSFYLWCNKPTVREADTQTNPYWTRNYHSLKYVVPVTSGPDKDVTFKSPSPWLLENASTHLLNRLKNNRW